MTNTCPIREVLSRITIRTAECTAISLSVVSVSSFLDGTVTRAKLAQVFVIFKNAVMCAVLTVNFIVPTRIGIRVFINSVAFHILNFMFCFEELTLT